MAAPSDQAYAFCAVNYPGCNDQEHVPLPSVEFLHETRGKHRRSHPQTQGQAVVWLDRDLYSIYQPLILLSDEKFILNCQ